MQNIAPEDDLMSPKETADYLKISTIALAKRRHAGKSGPAYVKISKKLIRYRRRDIDQWLDRQLVKSASIA